MANLFFSKRNTIKLTFQYEVADKMKEFQQSAMGINHFGKDPRRCIHSTRVLPLPPRPFLVNPWPYKMNMYYTFLTLALDEGEWSRSHFTPGKRTCTTQCMTLHGAEIWWQRGKSLSLQQFNCIIQPVGSSQTILAQITDLYISSLVMFMNLGSKDNQMMGIFILI
jgi:hypothetical protein